MPIEPSSTRLDRIEIEAMFAAFGLATPQDRDVYAPGNYGVSQPKAVFAQQTEVVSHTNQGNEPNAKLAPVTPNDSDSR